MSDSDDTDVLLLIPPDFFIIHSSDSEDSLCDDSRLDQALVNNLISHVNELEDRIAHIENKESLPSQLSDSIHSMHSSYSSSHLHPSVNTPNRRFGNSVFSESSAAGSDSNLHASPSRKASRFSSLPPTPSSSSYRSYDPHAVGKYNTTPRKNVLSEPSTEDSVTSAKSDGTIFSKPISNKAAAMAVANFRDSNMLAEIDTFLDSLKRKNFDGYDNEKKKQQLVVGTLPPSPQKRTSAADEVACLQLDEVDRLLREVEAEQKSIEARLSVPFTGKLESEEIKKKTVIKPGEIEGSIPGKGTSVNDHWGGTDSFVLNEQNQSQPTLTACRVNKPGETVGSVPDLGFGVRESWENRRQQRPLPREPPSVGKTGTSTSSEALPVQTPKVFASRRRLDLSASKGNKKSQDCMDMQPLCDLQEESLEEGPLSSLPDYYDPLTSDSDLQSRKLTVESGANRERKIHPTLNKHIEKIQSAVVGEKKPLLSLADLWVEGVDDNITRENTKLFQKYEEERCRRQHCEKLVQALQAKLLESQQRLAVALRVDSDKDEAIRKLQGAWQSLVEHWRTLEEQRHSLTEELQRQRQSSNSEIKQMQQKLERCEAELSKALDLAHGYKEQSESTERIHAQQLEQLGSKVQEVERRLAAATNARNESQAREETIRKQYEQDHAKLLELQGAMEKASKALSSKEADAAVLTEEKAGLQTRLKEERARIDTLQQARDKLRLELEEANTLTQALQRELKLSSEQIESSKVELHDFYQSQLERVVREKLKEFQAQLDAAETTLQQELQNRERAMAQLAARQLQHVTEKHQVEVSLLEEKHAEELRLMRLQLMDANRQIKELQTRLVAHEKRSSNLAERLHAVMENQWKEALNILSSPNELSSKERDDACVSKCLRAGGSGDVDRAWMLVQQQQHKQAQKEHSTQPEMASVQSEMCEGGSRQTPRGQSQSSLLDGGDELKKYIKMLLERAPGNPVEDCSAGGERRSGSSLSKSSQSLSQGNVNGRTSEHKPPWK